MIKPSFSWVVNQWKKLVGAGIPKAGDVGLDFTPTGNIAGATNSSEAFQAIDSGSFGGGGFWIRDVINSYLSPSTITDQIAVGDGSSGLPSYSFASDIDTGMYLKRNGNLAFSTNGFERFVLLPNGSLSGPKAFISGGSGAGAPTYSFADDTDTGMYSPFTNGIVFSLGGIPVGYFRYGSFGLGESSPSARAHFVGPGNDSLTWGFKVQNSAKLDPTLGIRDDRTLWTNGEKGASGTIDLTTATQIVITNGLITGWS